MANYRQWYYLRFYIAANAVIDPNDRRIINRMQLIPFYLKEDADSMLSFVLKQFPGMDVRGEVESDRLR